MKFPQTKKKRIKTSILKDQIEKFAIIDSNRVVTRSLDFLRTNYLFSYRKSCRLFEPLQGTDFCIHLGCIDRLGTHMFSLTFGLARMSSLR